MPVDPATAGAIIGGVQSIGNLFTQNANRKRQQRHNRQLAELQHKQNMELLKYQLDYNTPSAQMQRYKDAGLNPHLIYGQGSSGNMASAPQYPTIQPTDMSITLPNMLEMYQRVAQTDLIKTQADLNSIKGQEAVENTQLKKVQAELARANPILKEGYTDLLIEKLKAQNNLLSKQSVLSEVQTEINQFQVNKMMPKQLEKLNADIQNVLKRNGLLDEQKDLTVLKQKAESMGLEIKAQQLSVYELDRLIKERIIQSQQFQNDILQVHRNFMVNGDFNAQTGMEVLKLIISGLGAMPKLNPDIR